MSAYVYMLAHVTEPRVKIGKAVDVYARAKTLGKGKFDLERSKVYLVDTEAAALQLERILHLVFDSDRLHPKTVNQSREDGDTEWFPMECMQKAQEFLSSTANFIKFQPVEIDSIKPGPVDSVDRQQRRQKKAAADADKHAARMKKWEAKRIEAEAAVDVAIETATDRLNVLCANVTRIALLPRKRQQRLVFTASKENSAAVDEMAFDLLDASYKTSSACVGLFSGITYARDLPGGEMGVVVTVGWDNPFMGLPLEKLFSRFRNLRPAVEGWCDEGLTEEAYQWAKAVYAAVEG